MRPLLPSLTQCGTLSHLHRHATPCAQVAETRQLKEEEEVLMIRAVEGMQALYAAILYERTAQGMWLTNLELAVQSRPPEEAQWAMVRRAGRGGSPTGAIPLRHGSAEDGFVVIDCGAAPAARPPVAPALHHRLAD
jgi:hypothetical protein